jgi:hypothetical protein
LTFQACFARPENSALSFSHPDGHRQSLNASPMKDSPLTFQHCFASAGSLALGFSHSDGRLRSLNAPAI